MTGMLNTEGRIIYVYQRIPVLQNNHNAMYLFFWYINITKFRKKSVLTSGREKTSFGLLPPKENQGMRATRSFNGVGLFQLSLPRLSPFGEDKHR